MTAIFDAPMHINHRALADAIFLLTADPKTRKVDLAQLGSTMERYWSSSVWRTAIAEAMKQVKAGRTYRDAEPIRPRYLPSIRYFNHDSSDCPVAVLESRVDDMEDSFFTELDEVSEEWVASNYGPYKLHEIQIACIEAECEFCGL